MTGQKRSDHGSTSSAVATVQEEFLKNTVVILRTKRRIVKLDTDKAWRVAEAIGFAIIYVAIAFIVPALITIAFGGY